MSSPLISVIVPIYNMESLLPRCLDSLAAQTLRDLEIICVDDGSTYEAVIVSFGSHVTNKVSAISVDDFRKNYMAFVSQLSKRCRFLILATSTSIMDGPDGTLNEEKEKTLAAFNAIVREAASSLPGAVLSDHHGFMQGRRYIDPFHFSPPDRAYQAGKTAGLLLPLLSARQEPPKEQECPKTRPEP